ncbi:MAG TPA: alpha/beta fold hydrolase [Dactylosporangium sp.]|nr:alpha/beta fold hydrolase [Dactylosporangium sp.]
MSALRTKQIAGIRYFDSFPGAAVGETPIVLIHSPGSSLDFWNAVAPALRRQRRTVALDLPGFGGTPRPPGRLDLASLGAGVGTLLDAIGVRNAVVVGFSLGGAVALRVAADRPDLVRGVALLSGCLFSARRMAERPFGAVTNPRQAFALGLQFLESLIPIGEATKHALLRSKAVRVLLFSPFVARPAVLDPDRVLDAVSHVNAVYTARLVRLMLSSRRTRFEDLMREVHQPAALIWGADDPMMTNTDAQHAEELLHVVLRRELPDCGHWPMLERPDDVVGFLIRYARQLEQSGSR